MTTNKEFSKVYGAIHFKESKLDYKILLTNDNYDELIRCINHSDIVNIGSRTIQISEEEFPSLSKYITDIYFEYKPDKNNFLWWNGRLQSGNVANDESATQNIISKKEKSSLGYSNDFDQKWLIIYAAGLGLADIYSEFDNESKRQGSVFVMSFENKEYKTKSVTASSTYFTHIYVWDKFHEKIFLVAPYYKKIFDYGQKTIWVNHLPLKPEEQ